MLVHPSHVVRHCNCNRFLLLMLLTNLRWPFARVRPSRIVLVEGLGFMWPLGVSDILWRNMQPKEAEAGNVDCTPAEWTARVPRGRTAHSGRFILFAILDGELKGFIWGWFWVSASFILWRRKKQTFFIWDCGRIALLYFLFFNSTINAILNLRWKRTYQLNSNLSILEFSLMANNAAIQSPQISVIYINPSAHNGNSHSRSVADAQTGEP